MAQRWTPGVYTRENNTADWWQMARPWFNIYAIVMTRFVPAILKQNGHYSWEANIRINDECGGEGDAVKSAMERVLKAENGVLMLRQYCSENKRVKKIFSIRIPSYFNAEENRVWDIIEFRLIWGVTRSANFILSKELSQNYLERWRIYIFYFFFFLKP